MEIQQLNGFSPSVSPPSTGVAKPAQEQAPSVPVSADAVQAVSQTVNGNQLKQAVDMANKVIQALSNSSDLKFDVDKDSGERVVKVIDQATKEVIRQIPSEEMLSIARSLDKLQGLLIKQKA